MASISAFKAKSGLGNLLDRVQSGEEITITRHGQAVAKLIPVNESDADKALSIFKEVREDLKKRKVKISRKEIQQWIKEGRR